MQIEGKKFGYLVILGGGLVKDEGSWRTANLYEADAHGLLGDRLRVIAASMLFKENEDMILLASGGKGQNKNTAGFPPLARVIEKELLALQVPQSHILKEEHSGTTYQQLREAARKIKNKNTRKTGIISNAYHLPRIRAMIKHAPELEPLSNSILISAESVVLEREPHKWEEMIRHAYSSAAMKKREAQEQKGIRDIRKEDYCFT